MAAAVTAASVTSFGLVRKGLPTRTTVSPQQVLLLQPLMIATAEIIRKPTWHLNHEKNGVKWRNFRKNRLIYEWNSPKDVSGESAAGRWR
jgi:hypothetical protein